MLASRTSPRPPAVGSVSRARFRVPGLGKAAVGRILSARRVRSIRADDLKRLRVPVRKALPFLVFPDHSPGRLIDRIDLKTLIAPPAQQLSFGF